jgi:protein-S-isoprenylcysteine O-methyltransferase Ste14
MFLFLIPLVVGFTLNSASAFTTYFAKKLGERAGRITCTVLRNVVGIPIWATGFILAVRRESTSLFNSTFFTSLLASILLLVGAVIIIVGLVSIRIRAAAPSVNDTLVADGVYAHVRHPLYSGMILELLGLFLSVPTLTVLMACLLGVIWVVIQARLEELDLVKRIPAYKDYMQRVPRFIPKLNHRKQ